MHPLNRRLQFRTVAVLTVLLPFSSFIICVLWSLYFNFASSTATHCGVPNYLPSVSAAIGDYLPQKYIWRVAIALHTIPRIKIAFVYFVYFTSILVKHTGNLIRLNCALNLIEIFSLFGLTFISSTENYAIHKSCFITFLLTSTIYMALSLYLLRYRRSTTPNAMESKSYRLKWRLFITTMISILGAVYYFARHNNYCEPLMYTWFALCEYSVIICNMAFHMTAYWDFPNREWSLNLKPTVHAYQPFRV